MRIILISTCLLINCILISFVLTAQSVTGSWYGVADPANRGTTNNYLTELVIRQKGTDVEGVFGYYFRSGYQSYYVRGTYDPKTRILNIKNIPVTYFNNIEQVDSIDCPMDFSATLLVSKVKSKLTGSFISHSMYKYTCPELKVNFILDSTDKKQDSVINNNTGKIKKIWQPRNEELVLNTKDIDKAPVVKDAVFDKLDKARLDSIEQKKQLIAKLVKSFEQRKNIFSKEVEVDNDSIRVSYYDNGDIDGDSITVFINKVPVLTHQLLTGKALNMYLAMDSKRPATEISMYAENLGKIAPNTALMIITDGDRMHEVYLSSTLMQNASVIIKRRKRN